MNDKQKFAVIFDMDGVLVDSTEYIWESFNRAVEPMGVHFDESAIRRYLGNSLRDQVAMWEDEYGINVGDPGEFSIKAHKIQMELMKEVMNPDENLVFLLECLKKKGVPMGVGTSSTRARAEDMLSVAGVDHYFSALVTAEDVVEHKPNPHVFLEVARRLNVEPASCVVVEDAASGVAAAKNGNMKSIGFLTDWNSAEELSNADVIIHGFNELSCDVLERILSTDFHHATERTS